MLQVIFKKTCSGNVLKVEFLELIGSQIMANDNPLILLNFRFVGIPLHRHIAVCADSNTVHFLVFRKERPYLVLDLNLISILPVNRQFTPI